MWRRSSSGKEERLGGAGLVLLSLFGKAAIFLV
jgi:hypothetical protein